MLHYFTILEHEEEPFDLQGFTNFAEFHQTHRHITMDDELIQRMSNSFNWLKSEWPTEKQHPGLAYYGDSVVRGADVVQLRKIMIAWQRIFELAPTKVRGSSYYDWKKQRVEYEIRDQKDILAQYAAAIELLTTACDEHRTIVYEGI